MSKAKTQAIDFLKELGSVNAVTTEASNVSLPESLTYNSHIHLPPNFSAFETVEQAVELAADQGVRVLGCGNYYDYSVYQRFTETARDKNVFPSFGTEIIALETDLQQKDIRINDPGNPGRHYICGKAISRFEDLSSRADELLSGIRNNDKLRMTEMVVKMAAVFSEHGIDTGLDDQAVIARVVKRHGCSADTVTLQERHLAQAFQEVFFDEVSEGQRQQKLTDIFRVSSQSNPSDTVGIQNEIARIS